MHMTKTNQAVIVAFEKGYRVTPSGAVVNRHGKIRKCSVKSRKTDKRFVFSVCLHPKESFPVPVHKLVAYQKFGLATFNFGVVVRHLDGNAFNNNEINIALGSFSDNTFDRPARDRQLHAQKAGKASSPHTDEFWAKVKNDYASGLGYKKLRIKYGLSLSTLSYQLSKIGKYITLENR